MRIYSSLFFLYPFIRCSSSSIYNNIIAPRHARESVTLPLFEQKEQVSHIFYFALKKFN
jgi:hypothetical protein